ncbi:MAG: hypothetical protein E7590_00645 [Ruminococcaceae bacterium]|nr:hypothetical protein [Oscillospiraceae bacterium]
MKLTRILALCLALLMCLAAFAACNQPDPDEGEEAGAETPAITEHLLIDEGITEYVIVRDYKASNAILAAVNEVVESIKANIGADVIIKECFSDLENEPLDVVTAKEILIGNTNRPESAEAVKGMRSKDYTISMHGEKLVIAGGGEAGTLTAITKFMNDIVAEQGDRFAVRSGEFQNLVMNEKTTFNYVGTYSYSQASLGGISINSFNMIYPKNSDDCKNFANELSAYISRETGYDLNVYKDTRYTCCYEILIGETLRTEEGLMDSLADDEYYIKYVKLDKCSYEDCDGAGAQLIICYGEDARAAALEAFMKQIMPVTAEPTTFDMAVDFVLTNKAQ